MRSVLHLSMIFIVACSSGSHFAVLQSVAWAGMFVHAVADEGDVARALSVTFDGEHPCRLCGAIAETSDDDAGGGEKVPVPSGSELGWKLVPSARLELIPPPPARLGLSIEGGLCVARDDLPSVPPPRAV